MLDWLKDFLWNVFWSLGSGIEFLLDEFGDQARKFFGINGSRGSGSRRARGAMFVQGRVDLSTQTKSRNPGAAAA